MYNAPPNAPPPTPKGSLPAWAVIVIIVSCLFGTCMLGAPLASYGMSKYLRHSKTAEALTNVRIIAEGAKQSYAVERMPEGDAVLKPGQANTPVHAFCKSAASPVPKVVSTYGKTPVLESDWGGDDDTGWRCLRFAIDVPIYYQYSYTATRDSFEVVAHGDLNGDGVLSTFRIRGKAVDGEVTLAPIEIENEDE